ncbi:hypothetical protein H6H01_29655 [Nostoc calcicola FACHB-3891]|nr:hypothetical protein [Nostoc calcicola FACHB-3891]
MKTFTSKQNTPCGSLMVSFSNALSVISCFDIKIDIDKLIRSRMAIAPRITHLTTKSKTKWNSGNTIN